MRYIVGGRIYDTDTAELFASDEFRDGNNRRQHGTNTYLYRTRKGAWFAHHATSWVGCHNHVEPLSEAQALELYELLDGAPDKWPGKLEEA